MKYHNNNVISCFYVINLVNNYFINCMVFDSEKNFTSIQESKTNTEGIKEINSLKSVTMKLDGIKKVLVLFNNNIKYK